jgi:hypothetical protein
MKETYQTARPASGLRWFLGARIRLPRRLGLSPAVRGAKFAQERRLELARIAYLVGASAQWYE